MTNAFSKIAKATLGLVVGAAVLATAVPALALTASDISMLQAAGIISASQAASLMASIGTTTTSTGSCYVFTTSLSMGMTSPAVQQLQMVLNSNAATMLAVPAGSNGSAGHETTYFGAATNAAVMKYQALNGLAQVGNVGPMTRADLNKCTTSGPVTTTGGSTTTTNGVTAMLSTDNPAAGNVLTGQATADLAHFTFTGSGTISALTLQRTGLSTSSGLANVYLYNGTTRITDAAAVNTNGTISFGGLNLVVNGSMTISVRADIYSASTDVTVGVNLTSYTVNGTTVTTNLAGNLMYVSSGTGLLATVVLGSVNSAPTATVNAGATQYTMWSDSVAVGTHAVQLKAARFTFIGSAPTNAVANLKLYVDGTPVATSAGIMSDQSGTYVAFDLTGTNSTGTTCGMGAGYCLTTGSHTVDVRGDITGGSSRTIQLSLMNQADLMVTDSQTGGVNVGATTGTTTAPFSSNAGGTITINGTYGGTVTATIDPNFSSATNITGGSTNATIAKYTLTAYGENEKVMQVLVTPTVATGTPTTTTLNNVTLYYNGAQVGTSQNYSGTGSITFNLGSSLIVSAGTTGSLEVHADLQNAGGSNYTAGTIQVSGNIPVGEVQGTSSLQTNQSIVTLPTTNGLSIQTGLLAIAMNPSYTNQSISPNTAGAKIGSFILQNQSSSDSVRVTNLQLSVLFGAGAGSTNISNLRTSETSGSGSTPINPSTVAAGGTSVNNFPVDFTLAPSATKVIDVFADLSTASGMTVTVQTKLQLTALSTGANTTICSASMTGGAVNGCNTGTSASGQTITAQTGTFGAPVLVSSSSTQAQYVAVGTTAGVTNASVATFNFTSTGGTATINELKFTVTATGTPVSSVSVTDTAGSHTAYVIGGVADLTGLNLPVPNGAGGINLQVYSSYGAAGSTGTTSGSTATLALTYVKYQSGTTTGTTSPNVAAPTITVVASVPALTVATPAVSLSVGNVEAIDVSVTANTAGNVTLNTLPITLSATNATFSTSANTIIVKDQNGNTITTTSTAISSSTSGTPVVTFSGGYLMTAGSTTTFKVYVPVAGITGSGVNSSSIYASVAPASSFTWTDTAGNGVSGAGTGSLINNFPTNNSVVHN